MQLLNLLVCIYLFIFPISIIAQEIDDEDKKSEDIIKEKAKEKAKEKPKEKPEEKDKEKKPRQNTNYFEYAIQNFENEDKKNFPPASAIVCIGSSSMRFWHPTIEKDLAPLTIIPRGFGGSDLADAIEFVDRIVTPYKPRAIVIYAGENDIVMGAKPEKVAEDYRKFVKKVHQESPVARIYFISIKPSVGRWYIWGKMHETNQLIEKDCAKDKRLIFVDMTTAMLDSEGKPRDDLFGRDGYHLSKDGYVVWREVLKPILLKNELEFEPKKVDQSIIEEPKKIVPLKSKDGQ